MRQNNCTEKSDRGTDIIKKYCSRFPSIRGMDRVRMEITSDMFECSAILMRFCLVRKGKTQTKPDEGC